MAVDWASFSPGPATVGGALVGLAAALLILGAGRVAGVAGIVGGALQGLVHGRRPGRDALRWAFVAGLVAAPWLWRIVAPLPAANSGATIGVLIVAGLLVGIGVRMGGGCTSGHGICGLSRLSLRSLANVLAFVATGMVTVALMRLGFGF